VRAGGSRVLASGHRHSTWQNPLAEVDASPLRSNIALASAVWGSTPSTASTPSPLHSMAWGTAPSCVPPRALASAWLQEEHDRVAGTRSAGAGRLGSWSSGSGASGGWLACSSAPGAQRPPSALDLRTRSGAPALAALQEESGEAPPASDEGSERGAPGTPPAATRLSAFQPQQDASVWGDAGAKSGRAEGGSGDVQCGGGGAADAGSAGIAAVEASKSASGGAAVLHGSPHSSTWSDASGGDSHAVAAAGSARDAALAERLLHSVADASRPGVRKSVPKLGGSGSSGSLSDAGSVRSSVGGADVGGAPAGVVAVASILIGTDTHDGASSAERDGGGGGKGGGLAGTPSATVGGAASTPSAAGNVLSTLGGGSMMGGVASGFWAAPPQQLAGLGLGGGGGGRGGGGGGGDAMNMHDLIASSTRPRRRSSSSDEFCSL
jgi:hypothetical protein